MQRSDAPASMIGCCITGHTEVIATTGQSHFPRTYCRPDLIAIQRKMKSRGAGFEFRVAEPVLAESRDLDFQKDSLAPQEEEHDPADQHRAERIDQRSVGDAQPGRFEIRLSGFMPIHLCPGCSCNGKSIAGTVNQGICHEACDGVHAEYEDRHRPSPMPASHLGGPIKQREKQEAEAAAEQDKGTGPHVFIDGEPAIPEFATKHSQKPKEDHPGDELRRFSL
jgi:hypothetical protein